MINGNIINGNVINGSSGIDLAASASDAISIGESLFFSRLFGLLQTDQIEISEQISFKFNKGLPQAETVEISEHLDIEVGNLILHIDDDPVEILESLNFNLQKGALVQDLLKYYLNLLILQYKNKPKAIGHVTTLVTQAFCDLLPQILERAFDLETAEGVQLDIIGKYIGIKRRVNTFTGSVTLSDSDYRILLKVKRATNTIGSSFAEIQNFIYTNLKGSFFAFDHANMSMSFYINSTQISSDLAQAIVEQGVLPKPMGVSYASIVYLPSLDNIFGFDDYNFISGSNVGFDTYSSYDPTKQFLKYEDTI